MDLYQAYTCFYDIGKNEIVLDLGCRYGNLLKFCCSESYGVDVNSFAINICKERGLNAILADVTKGLPFDDEYFDVVFCKHVIEHVEKTSELMKESWRVLKKNGRLILITPNVLKRKFKFYDDAEHVKPFTPRALRQILWDNKFELQEESFEPKFIFPFYSVFKDYFDFFYNFNVVLYKLGFGQKQHIYIIGTKIGDG